MPKANPSEWLAQRRRWESDPNVGISDVAAALGVDKGAVSRKARRDGWMRVTQPNIAETMAQTVATLAETPLEVLVDADVLDLSVACRVKVIQKHREDWRRHREIFTPEVVASSEAQAKRAKLAAEMLAIRQRGESISYGLTTWTGASTDAPIVDEVPPEEPTDFDRAMRHLLETGELPPWQRGSLPVEDVPSRAVEAPARAAEQEVEDAPYR